MKKVTICGVRSAKLIDVPIPQAREDWVLVKLMTVPMCTEYKLFNQGITNCDLGHEGVGEIVQIDSPCGLKIGDRVVVMPLLPCGKCEFCRRGEYIYCQNQRSPEAFVTAELGTGTYAQYILKPAYSLVKIPDDIDYDMASLSLCALGPSFGALNALNARPGQTLLVTGLGPVGMGALVNARYYNLRVIAVDSLKYRVDKAKEFGAEKVIDPTDPEATKQILAASGGQGVDLAIDCSGTPGAHRLCIDSLKRRGSMAFVGECSDSTCIHVSDDMIRKGLHLLGNWHYGYALYEPLMQVIRSLPLARQLITHIFSIKEIQHAFELSASPEHIKILLHPWDE